MEIRILKPSGVPHAEVEAHKTIQAEFDSTAFSKRWRGYAAFALARRGRASGDDDFDLVLVTHTNIVVIELKNWNGQLLESDGKKWFLDGEDRGASPVEVVNLKAKKLARIMTQKLGPERTPFVGSFVVLHGRIKQRNLTPDEDKSVLELSEFLSLRFHHCYRDYFWESRGLDPTAHLVAYDKFFQGESFRPKIYYVDGFRPDSEPIFEHPRKLYCEFGAVAKDDPNARALLRQWNFNSLGLEMLAARDRSDIGLREQRVYQYVADRNQELSLSLLRPLHRKSARDVTLDFAELFALPNEVTRLAEFTHSILPKLNSEERLLLVKTLVSRFAELHDLRIAHRDVDDHSIWLNRSGRVVISGFPAAHFPEMHTVGAVREKVKVGRAVLPEDTETNRESTPYRRDVFMLGALAHLLLHGEKPPLVSGTYRWTPSASGSVDEAVDGTVRSALTEDPSNRFADARQMLDAINAATAQTTESIIDASAFDAFRPATKERDYDQTVVFHDDDSFCHFRSDASEHSFLVKVWYGISSDPKQQDKALRLLSFLERCRTLQTLCLPGIQSIVDCGLTRGSVLLVMNWVTGESLSDWLGNNPSLEKRLSVARMLTTTLARLHELELAHGDVHPANIVVDEEGAPLIVDVADLNLSGADRYTPAYLPEHHTALSPFERDRYGLAATLVEVLGSPCEPFPIPDVHAELENIQSAKTLSTLKPLLDVLEKAEQPKQADAATFTLATREFRQSGEYLGELTSDNGRFHVSVGKDRKRANCLRIWVSGIGRQLVFVWNLSDERIELAFLNHLTQSELIRTQTMRDATAHVRIEIAEGPHSEATDLVRHVLAIEGINRRVSNAMALESETSEPGDDLQTADRRVDISSRALWSALLQAEEESFPTVTVAADARTNPHRRNQTLVPYHADKVIDYEPTDDVLVENQTPEGTWLRCGHLDLRNTSVGQNAQLAIDELHPRANLRIGAQLRLMSKLEKASLSRRRFAVERILEDKAVIPNLIDYLDPAINGSLPCGSYAEPSAEDLSVYSTEDRELNDSQKTAFQKVLSHGPVSLLQGPPGTGKTLFIACLLHYLITRVGVRRILLVSQSHEAVNNALEKGFKLCKEQSAEFHAVRLGSEAATSEAIRHFHSNAIEQAYRERFKAERRERVVRLATAIGLPRPFAEDFERLHSRLARLSKATDTMKRRLEDAPDEEQSSYEARVRALNESFWEIAKDVYGLEPGDSMQAAIAEVERSLMESYGVRSPNAVERLRTLVRLSNEWVESLGSRDANFAEFLAKTRTIVSGTLVGIGYRATGVVQNMFDWVIVDEASRAAPSELAVAMQAGQRILLVGDHLQLPPTFPEGVRDEMRRRYNASADSPLLSSDFARIFDSEYGRKVGATLLTQYRMAPDIGDLVSSCFYSSYNLKTERGAPEEYYDLLPEHLRCQVAWIDTGALGPKAHEQSSDDDVDKWNEQEARIVMRLLQQLLEAEDFLDFLEEDLQPNEPAVGVICMYSRQRSVIDKLMSEAVWLANRRRLVKVDTVDSYQGKENRIVILSTVRNNPSLKPGFLKSSNRINVAMSRAMDRLYIVGAQRMWEGPNANLPLGRVRKRVCEMASQGRAALLDPGLFLDH